jgi:hypothetical protein
LFFAGQLAQLAHPQTVGGGIANRAIWSRIAANNRFGTTWNSRFMSQPGGIFTTGLDDPPVIAQSAI